MSEPTYRVELTHHPENGAAVEWHAAIYLAGEDGMTVHDCYHATREQAFDSAQAWCKAKAQEPKAPSTVYLSEEGEILDRPALYACNPDESGGMR